MTLHCTENLHSYPDQKFVLVATSRMIGIHRLSVDLRRRPSSAFQSFPIIYNAGSAAFLMLAIVGNARPISSHFWNKMNDNARSNHWSSFIFLMTSHTIFVVFNHFLYSMLYEHIRISLNIIYSIINSCHITYLHCWCFCVLTGVEPGPFILRSQHSTPTLQGACEGGILVSPMMITLTRTNLNGNII